MTQQGYSEIPTTPVQADGEELSGQLLELVAQRFKMGLFCTPFAGQAIDGEHGITEQFNDEPGRLRFARQPAQRFDGGTEFGNVVRHLWKTTVRKTVNVFGIVNVAKGTVPGSSGIGGFTPTIEEQTNDRTPALRIRRCGCLLG